MGKRLDIGLSSYHGRGIITFLTTDGVPADIYFAEGRSPPSRKRKLWTPPERAGVVYMDVNSETTVEQMIEEGGNPKLLLYDAMLALPDGRLVVTNGFQTNYDAVWDGKGREAENLVDTTSGGIAGRLASGMDIKEAIHESLLQAGSEVDTIRTARIACARDYDKQHDLTNIGIVVRYRESGSDKFLGHDDIIVGDCRLSKGEGLLFATYGAHRPYYYAAKPPDISGGSMRTYRRKLHLDGTTAEQLLEEVWEGLPKDILVGVAVAMRDTNEACGFRFVTRNMKE